MKRSTGLMLALLLATSCGGDAVASTTSAASASSSSSTTSTTTTIPETTTEAGPTTTGGPPATLPSEIAQTVFAFAGGQSQIFVTVEVADSPNGPWLPAGIFLDFPPALSGPNYWVKFTIENQDELGQVVDVEISGESGFDLGTDVCALDFPIPIGGSDSCVVGDTEGFPVLSGTTENDFFITAKSQHQGLGDGLWFQPEVPTTLEFDGARHSFVFLFDVGSSDEGVRVDGKADGSAVAISGLSGPVRVDCSDGFSNGVSDTGGSPRSGEPTIVAYVIENFSRSGESQGGCAEIPTEILDMDIDGDTFAYAYVGP